MRVLILSCNTGGGHNSAGRAVQEELLRRGHDAVVADALAIAGKTVSQKADHIYVGITTRTPWAFRALYAAGGAISNAKLRSPVYGANRLYRKKLLEYIEQGRFDLIVTPHLFPAETLTSLKRSGLLRQKFIYVATDYTCLPLFEETRPDCFVVPSKELVPLFVKKGIPAERIKAFGIPVSRRFSQPGDRAAARSVLGLAPDRKVLLIMSGSMGFGNLSPLISRLRSRLSGAADILVLCGTNAVLREGLQSEFLGCPDVRTVGYTDQVALYMDACDLVLTKPGGLTTTEAANKRLPLVHTAPIPGCETKNAAFFASRGMSLCCPGSPDKMADAVAELMQSEEKQQKMRAAQEKYISLTAAADLCDYAEKIVPQKVRL